MIEPIMKELGPLVVSELYRANQNHPPFHSSHEGMAVIEEEVEEAKESMECIEYCIRTLKSDVFHDRFDEAEADVKTMRRHALYAAAELIQVAAMCDKYGLMSRESIVFKVPEQWPKSADVGKEE